VIEARHGVRCEGEITSLLDQQDTEVLVSAIEVRARLVGAGLEPPPLRVRGVAIEIVPQTRPAAGGLRGPRLGGDSWARIAPRVREKVDAASASGVNWLRLDARDGVWQFTEWSTRSLARKLQGFETAVRDLVGGIQGIVVSCGSLLRQGTFEDEDVVDERGLVAIRRCLPFSRVRETLLIPADPEALPTASCWADMYAHEASWLDWALAEVDLPPINEILRVRP
jgi:hypothetical protein